MMRTANQRAIFACTALAVCFTTLSVRLVQLQVSRHEEYAEKAARQNVHQEPIFARRGMIVDVNGTTLAQNEPVKTVVADASLIRDQAALAALLAGPLDTPVKEIRQKLARVVTTKYRKEPQPCRYIILKKDVPEAKATEISRLIEKAKREKIVFTSKAVRFEQDFVRNYPNGPMLCHVLGFVNEEGRGVEGIEASMNQELQGQDGYRFIERDRTDRELVPYRGEIKAPREGRTVRLTIDMSLQSIVETELDAAFHQFKPKKATIIMMNPKTGDIMAMANRPNFDPNPERDAHGRPAKSAMPKTAKEKEEFLERRKNVAITDQVEPGSTFKIVAASAALSERIVRPDTEVFCENAWWSWCKLRDHHPYGSLTVQDILVKSSNIGIAKLGIQLGDQRFYEYVRLFGFGDKTSVNLPGEIRGQVPPPYNWDKLTITRMPMGQSVAATPLQIINAMCTIANGGTLMFPQIVREIVHEDGTTTYSPREMHRVVTKKATDEVRDALVRVVSPKGTAVLGRVAGFKVAGKTGTAQKRDEHGKMAHDDYVVSFVGFLPADDPAFVVLVLLDEAQTKRGENYGGLVAAPIFSRVAEKAARYLNLQPTEDNVPPGSIFGRNDSLSSARDQ